jgi:hypothetical protein
VAAVIEIVVLLFLLLASTGLSLATDNASTPAPDPRTSICESFVDEKISGNDQKPDGILKSGALLTGMSN